MTITTERDQQIAEITKWITSTDTDEGKIKILFEQINEYRDAISIINKNIYDLKSQIQAEENNRLYFSNEIEQKKSGIRLLQQRIKEKD